MPGRLERHGRSKWEWGSPGARSGEVQAAVADDPEPPKRGKGKKDTRRWCRGKTGVEHDVTVVLHSWYGRKCGWRESGHWVYTGPVPPKGVTLPKWHSRKDDTWVVDGRTWSCLHEYQCQACGKYLGPAPECPDRQADC